MPNFFVERLRAAAQPDHESSEGKTMAFWIGEEQAGELEALAHEIGITRSALVRELLSIAVPMAWREVRPDVAQQQLFGEDLPFRSALGMELAAGEHADRVKQSATRRRKPPRKKQAAKRIRKAVAPRARGKRG
jgi:hypothetical protein